MPHETCDSDTGGSPAHRWELIATTDGVDGVAGQFRVRVSNVPLFRDVDGGLADRGSFVSVENPRVEVNQLSQNIDGELIVHLESHASERVTTNVSFTGMTVTRARFASFLGTDIEEMPLQARFGHDRHRRGRIEPGSSASGSHVAADSSRTSVALLIST